MLENFNNLLYMDGNGLFVWFCMAFFVLVVSLNILYAIKKKRQLIKLIRSS